MAQINRDARTALNVPGVPHPDLPYSQAIRAGGWIFVSAQMAVTPEGRVDPASPYRLSSPEVQSRSVLRSLATILDAAGCRIDRDVARIYWWLASEHPSYDEFAEGVLWPRIPSIDPLEWARNEVIPEPQPASTGIAVRELAARGAEIATGLIAIEPRPGMEKVGFDVPEDIPGIPDTPAVRFGDWIFVVGAVATDWDGDFMAAKNMGEPSALAPDARVNPYHWFGIPVETQVDYILHAVERIAENAGSSMKRAIKATVHIGHPNDFFAVDRAWQRWFPENPPARVVVPYSGLAGKGFRCEIAMKFLAKDSELSVETVETSGAPEPFGHEPQAVRVGDFLFFSTQLPLDSTGAVAPETIAEPESLFYGQEPRLQMRYMLQNVSAICEAAGTSLENICRRHAYYDDFAAMPPSFDEWGRHFPVARLDRPSPRQRLAAARATVPRAPGPDRVRATVEVARCAWAEGDELLRAYHDEEWGVPTRDARELFELLLLEGFQAGLSWLTILRKRERYREVLDGFDPERIAAYDDAKVAELLADPGIVRNRAKVAAAVRNARAYLELTAREGDFSDWIWGFAPPPRTRPPRPGEIPARTPEAEALSKGLRRAGFTFVGPTICYAFMQSAGLVDDHVAGCFRAPAAREARRPPRPR